MPITKIELDNATITEKELLDDKVGILDIKADLNENVQCDIEMQVVNQSNIVERLLFYWGKLYTKTIKQGKGYETGKKTIIVMIANFEIKELEIIKKYMTRWTIREEDYSSVVLTDAFEACIIELPKFVKYAESSKSKSLNLWVQFIKNPEVKFMFNEDDDVELKETKEAISLAQEKLEQLSNDEHERELADLRDKYIRDQYSIEKFGFERGKEEGLVEGKAEGKAENTVEIAKKMLNKNIDINLIIQCTGLSKEEIEKLK